jgi:NAD-dependent dihydropyrimidine dehydrogenase PreA subunit
MGIFIRIELDSSRFSSHLAAQLVSLCPVDIFALEGEKVQVRPEQEDECILCERCLEAAPVGALAIRKTYKEEVLRSRRRPDA